MAKLNFAAMNKNLQEQWSKALWKAIGMGDDDNVKIESMVGDAILYIENAEPQESEIIFTMMSGRYIKMHHHQDCCESVYLADITGDLKDIMYAPLTMAEEASSGEDADYGEHTTWTFYKFGTAKGCVTLRWCGTSNGYYSETVNLALVNANGRGV